MIPTLTWNATQKILECTGSWTILHLTSDVEQFITQFQNVDVLSIHAQNVTAFDSAGAEILLKIAKKYPKAQLLLNQEQQRLLNLLQSYSVSDTFSAPPPIHWVKKFGEQSYHAYLESLQYLTFVGESALIIFQWVLKPRKILWRNIAKIVETSGFYGIPIIGLLSFLVGVVLAYQIGIQLENYGANIYVVNLLGVSILREFAPLITAILVAGRTGAAFTAELGTMKVNEELDALKTMGIRPIEYLVMPKILGLIIAMPLLSMWAAFTGLLGGMIMSKGMLAITPNVFLDQFQEAVAVKQLWIGLIKTPIFAYIIASVGCFQGMQVSGGAESVGQQTTRSVVESLFLIIVVDALFSILLGIFHA